MQPHGSDAGVQFNDDFTVANVTRAKVKGVFLDQDIDIDIILDAMIYYKVDVSDERVERISYSNIFDIDTGEPINWYEFSEMGIRKIDWVLKDKAQDFWEQMNQLSNKVG